MFLFKWLKEYRDIQFDLLNKKREASYCESCETLKMQLAITNEEKKQLLNRILEKPEPEAVVDTRDLKPIMPAHMSWSARRQMLEAEDRAKAKVLRDNPALRVADKTASEVTELEKELGVNNG